MKTWMFWVIILVFIFVVIPLIYFAIVAKAVTKIADDSPAGKSYIELNGYDSPVKLEYKLNKYK